jgi:hypothetical protein
MTFGDCPSRHHVIVRGRWVEAWRPELLLLVRLPVGGHRPLPSVAVLGRWLKGAA